MVVHMVNGEASRRAAIARQQEPGNPPHRLLALNCVGSWQKNAADIIDPGSGAGREIKAQAGSNSNWSSFVTLWDGGGGMKEEGGCFVLPVPEMRIKLRCWRRRRRGDLWFRGRDLILKGKFQYHNHWDKNSTLNKSSWIFFAAAFRQQRFIFYLCLFSTPSKCA